MFELYHSRKEPGPNDNHKDNLDKKNTLQKANNY